MPRSMDENAAAQRDRITSQSTRNSFSTRRKKRRAKLEAFLAKVEGGLAVQGMLCWVIVCMTDTAT